ncbi:MAG: methanogenesis marker 6 protein [Methanothrix sp.]|nr:MAG: methanogenesis marker 6 protein [Methanothrix sp.]
MRVTKFVVTSQNSEVLPSDIAQMIYGSSHDVDVKETCFGVMIDGEEKEIDEVVKEIRAMDPPGIFIKDRGFPPGDPRRCRGHRGGGARPGFYMIEYESKILPLISKGLIADAEGDDEEPVPPTKKAEWLSPDKLEAIIKKEFS